MQRGRPPQLNLIAKEIGNLARLHSETASALQRLARALAVANQGDGWEEENEEALLAFAAAGKAANPGPDIPGEAAFAILRGAEPLRTMRKARGLTQAELSTRAKVGQGYISQIERGERRGSDSVLGRLAEALDAPVEIFSLPSGD